MNADITKIVFYIVLAIVVCVIIVYLIAPLLYNGNWGPRMIYGTGVWNTLSFSLPQLSHLNV
jgi:hypothetical protein